MEQKIDEERSFKAVCNLFHIENLKDYQKDCLRYLSQGKDCFVCQPTGSGKSVIFQALPFFVHFLKNDKNLSNDISKCCLKILVIFPLTSLMSDQEKKLEELGLKVTTLCENRDENDNHNNYEVSFFISLFVLFVF